jgi:16S rRNA (guanine966-N2)-methyltransferase
MRIIAGTAGGVKLEALRNAGVRPTTDRVRESLFNMLMPRLEDCRFLDLYAGTGANGIEALSRGAAHATFVDGSRQAVELIERNLQKTKLGDDAAVILKTLPNAIEDTLQFEAPYDIVFADPPYGYEDFPGLLTAVAANSIIETGGVLVLEHHRKQALSEAIPGLTLARSKVYGDTALSFFDID